MAVTATPVFAQTPALSILALSTANTNLDGSTGTYSSVFTPGSDGCRLELIRVVARGATTTGKVRIFLSLDSGSTYALYREFSVVAYTPSASISAYEDEYIPSKPLVLPSTGRIKCNTHNSENFNVFIIGGNL